MALGRCPGNTAEPHSALKVELLHVLDAYAELSQVASVQKELLEKTAAAEVAAQQAAALAAVEAKAALLQERKPFKVGRQSTCKGARLWGILKVRPWFCMVASRRLMVAS